MKPFVTGGAGFIGSHLVDRLIAEGNQITMFDNLSSGKKEFIKQHVGKGNFKLIKADLLNLDKVKGTIGRHDVVFHFAANTEARWGIENTELDLQQGTIATYSLLEVMRLNKVKKLIFASSGTVYGEATKAVSEDARPLLPDILNGFLTNPALSWRRFWITGIILSRVALSYFWGL